MRLFIFVAASILAVQVVQASECHFKAHKNIMTVAKQAYQKGELSAADLEYLKDYGYGSAYNASGNNYSCSIHVGGKERLVVVQILLTRTNGPASPAVRNFLINNESKFYSPDAAGPN